MKKTKTKRRHSPSGFILHGTIQCSKADFEWLLTRFSLMGCYVVDMEIPTSSLLPKPKKRRF